MFYCFVNFNISRSSFAYAMCGSILESENLRMLSCWVGRCVENYYFILFTCSIHYHNILNVAACWWCPHQYKHLILIQFKRHFRFTVHFWSNVGKWRLCKTGDFRLRCDKQWHHSLKCLFDVEPGYVQIVKRCFCIRTEAYRDLNVGFEVDLTMNCFSLFQIYDTREGPWRVE